MRYKSTRNHFIKWLPCPAIFYLGKSKLKIFECRRNR